MHVVNNFKGSIYMVFDYMDHDLTGLMQRRGNKFEVKHVSVCSTAVPSAALSDSDPRHEKSAHALSLRGSMPLQPYLPGSHSVSSC